MESLIRDRQPGVLSSGITGSLTLTKTGTTARTGTFPDDDIEFQGTTVEKSADFTARVHGVYLITATCTVTDPSTPVQGHEFVCFVRNGTATIGGTAYIAGQTVWRSYHSGAWSNSVMAALGTAQTWTALQTFSNGLTVSSGTTAMQAATCTTLTASGVLDVNHATTGDNAALLRNTHAAGYGPVFRGGGGSTGLYHALFQKYDGTEVARITGDGGLAMAGGVTCTTLTASSSTTSTSTTTGALTVAGGAGIAKEVVLTASSTGAVYWGPTATSGSTRMYGDGAGAVIFEKYNGSSWVEIGRFG